LYFLGLSTRKVAKALSFLHIVKRNHVSIWKWIQTYKPAKLTSKRRKISEFVVVETIIQVSSEFLLLWTETTEPKNRSILTLSISKERNMFVAQSAYCQYWLKILENFFFYRWWHLESTASMQILKTPTSYQFRI
jgi:hypothetical protein